jgi:Clp protease
MAGTLRKLRGTLVECYRRRTRQSETTVSKWLDGETWFDSKEAIAVRLADEVDDQPSRLTASVDLGRFKNLPRRLAAANWDRVISAKFQVS